MENIRRAGALFAVAAMFITTDVACAQEAESPPLVVRLPPTRPAPAPEAVPPAEAEAVPVAAPETPATPQPNETPPPAPMPVPATETVPPEMLVEAKAPPVSSWLEAQIELARRGFSSGSIDGAVGPKTRAALRAFQQSESLPASGELDAATRARLVLNAPSYTQITISEGNLAALQPVSKTWLGKSQQSALAYETALEAVAERFHAHPGLIRQLNPSVDWEAVTPETALTVPAVERVTTAGRAARIQISLTDCVLEAFDASERVIAHFPVSIGATAEKRPAGELSVTTAAANPNYTFDPAVFPESAEARELQGRKLILPPGPNNPVGVAWIGLDRPGYGIHGTPSPERVGRAESHGCFRLANWDARTLLQLVRIGMPVQIEP